MANVNQISHNGSELYGHPLLGGEFILADAAYGILSSRSLRQTRTLSIHEMEVNTNYPFPPGVWESELHAIIGINSGGNWPKLVASFRQHG